LAVKGFHFHNQATRMTLKRFRPFSTWKLIFLFWYLYYWPFFLMTVLYLSLLGVPFFGSSALNMNLSLNSGTELSLSQIQWSRSTSRLNIGEGYFAIFCPFTTLRGWSRTDPKGCHFL